MTSNGIVIILIIIILLMTCCLTAISDHPNLRRFPSDNIFRSITDCISAIIFLLSIKTWYPFSDIHFPVGPPSSCACCKPKTTPDASNYQEWLAAAARIGILWELGRWWPEWLNHYVYYAVISWYKAVDNSQLETWWQTGHKDNGNDGHWSLPLSLQNPCLWSIYQVYNYIFV